VTKTNVKVDRKVLYIDGAEVRIGVRGRPVSVEFFYGGLPKGERRRIRKGLHADGHKQAAALPAVTC
jgi:hypothetical protein